MGWLIFCSSCTILILIVVDGDALVYIWVGIHVELQFIGNLVGGGIVLSVTLGQDVVFYGFGDLVGVDGWVVVWTESRNWIINFEVNYLFVVDFYDEDFFWCYTLVALLGDYFWLWLWIMLVVLIELELGWQVHELGGGQYGVEEVGELFDGFIFYAERDDEVGDLCW